METFDAIITRRSCRKFKDKKISKELIEEILKAAMYAPSAYNEQPWQFIVIDDRKLLDEIPNIHPHANMCKTAPLAILVCADLTKELSENMYVLDCAAATQNIMLSAHDQNIGSVWVGIYFRKDHIEAFTKFLNLPKHIVPISLVPLGYPDEEIKKATRFKKDRIHYNSF
ncbi:MAG: Oxygen-insensitive NADPH nitroreductase [Candidatus Anoxychlamydiales bacterium]|nr:Oxygen-insensitive NADPH nitroreductase [Candidatus Anoxychlamydiales bacterium]